MKKVLTITKADTKEIKVGAVTMQHFSMAPLEWAFGSDGETAIMMVGTLDPAKVLRRASVAGNNITKHPLYKELRNFKEFPVWAAGFADVPGMAKVASAYSLEVARLVDDLGLNGLKSVTMHSGFDGQAERTVVDINMPAERKGLLAVDPEQDIFAEGPAAAAGRPDSFFRRVI